MYIDPNTGGMLFQVLAVLFGVFSAAILFFSGRIRMMFARIRRKMREKRGTGAPSAPPDDPASPSA